jgi:hypothetical protein
MAQLVPHVTLRFSKTLIILVRLVVLTAMSVSPNLSAQLALLISGWTPTTLASLAQPDAKSAQTRLDVPSAKSCSGSTILNVLPAILLAQTA